VRVMMTQTLFASCEVACRPVKVNWQEEKE
jgi:hypothetical protein